MKKKSIMLSISFIILLISYFMIYKFINNNFSFKLAEVHFLITPSKFIEISNNFSIKEKNSYLYMTFFFDIIWPLSYSFFFFNINQNLYNSSKINKLIVIIFIFDMLENLLTARFLFSNNPLYIYPCTIFTNIKWILIFIISLSLLFNLTKFIILKIKKINE